MKWEVELQVTIYVEAETEREAKKKAQEKQGHLGGTDVRGVWPMTEKEWHGLCGMAGGTVNPYGLNDVARKRGNMAPGMDDMLLSARRVLNHQRSMQEQIVSLVAERDALQAELEAVEWGGTTADHMEGGRTSCPRCSGLKPFGNGHGGHVPGCTLDAALKAAKEE